MIAPLYDLIFILPLCQIAILVAGPYVGIPERNVLGCIVSVLAAVFIHLMRYLSIKGKFITAGVVGTIFFGVYFALGKDEFAVGIGKISWIGICLLLTLGAYVLGLLMAYIKPVRRIAALVLLGGSVYFMIVEKQVPKFAVVMCFLVILLCFAEEIQESWKKSGYTKVKDHMVTIFPVLFITCMSLMFISTPAEPFDWSFAKEAWKNVRFGVIRISDWISKPDEAYTGIGFSGDGAFLNQLDDTDKEALKVKIYRSNPQAFYLTGETFDTFGSNGWTTEISDGENSRMMDVIEIQCAVSKWDPQNEDAYIIKTQNDIESLMKKTQYIFLPSKPIINPRVFLQIPYIANASAVRSNDDIVTGDIYTISYYALNRTNPQFAEMINNAQEISREEWEAEVSVTINRDFDVYSYEAYQEYREWIYSNYCESDVASDEVKALLAEITSGADTPYEQMRAIVNYLKGFEYSVNPGALPSSVVDSKSYLDYFLLESKTGYCVHYATALVLLARECGMPARFAEGYYVQNTNEEYVTVKESSAHAWAEVYFDNVGWITFDPTPGYSNEFGWDENGESTVYMPGTHVSVIDKTEVEAEDENPEEESSEDKSSRILNGLRIILIPIAAVLVFLMLYVLVSRVLLNHRYLRMSDENKIKNLTKRNFRILRILGYDINNYETLSEYKDRVALDATREIVSGLSFIEAFEEITYADRKITSDTVKRFEDSHNILKRELCNTKRFCRMLYL